MTELELLRAEVAALREEFAKTRRSMLQLAERYRSVAAENKATNVEAFQHYAGKRWALQTAAGDISSTFARVTRRMKKLGEKE